MTNRHFGKVLALMLAVILCFGTVTALAEGMTYTAVPGTSVQFAQYLVFDKNAYAPIVTFTYSIAPGEKVDPSAGRAAVLAGLGTPSVGSAAFTAASAKNTSVQTGDNITLGSNEAYTKAMVAIDFSGVSFDEPGIYRYVLTCVENAGAMGIAYDAQKSAAATAKIRYVDVYIADNSSVLAVDGYVIHDDIQAPAVGADMGTTAGGQDNKSDGFVNSYATQDLTFSKAVSGNQGSKDKYFLFTLKFSGAIPGTEYDVDLSAADTSSGATSSTLPANQGKTNPLKLTADADGKVEQSFYLKHGQRITVLGIAAGTSYSVSENEEDYSPSITGTSSGQIADADVQVDFTNTRAGTVPTGVALTLLPGIVICLVAGGAFLMLIRRKRENDT